jgi:hypothetical protein
MSDPIDDDDPWAPLPPGALWSDRAGEVIEGPRPQPVAADWTPPPPLPRKPKATGATAAAVAAEAGPGDGDPAAAAEMFARLPPAAQDEVRALAQQRVQNGRDRKRLLGRARNRRFVAGVACSVATLLAGTGAQWHATVGAGICCGIWWRHAQPDRFLDPLVAMSCFFAMHLLAMFASGGEGQHPLGWVDLCVFGACAAVVGFDGEIRRTGGFGLK